jgi:hypothetical protein
MEGDYCYEKDWETGFDYFDFSVCFWVGGSVINGKRNL